MMKHYFLTIFLPELNWESEPCMSFSDLIQLYEVHLSEDDFNSIIWVTKKLFNSSYDMPEELNFAFKDIDAALNEPELKKIDPSGQPAFIQKYCEFLETMKLNLAILRAKKLAKKIEKNDQLVDDSPFEESLAKAEAVFEYNCDNPFALHQELLKLQYDAVDVLMDQYQDFSVDRIYGYFIKYMLHRQKTLAAIKNLNPVDKLLKEFQI